MAAPNAVWGIEVGQCALKAVKLRPAEGGKVELLAFDLIEHPKILSQPDAEPDELISAALEKFVSRNDWQGDSFVIGVPGQQTFARFCKLPPVESKKIPEIVRFEASQQIPFEMSDVVWDYQVFQAEDAPDVEVGIFAMRKDLIRKHLEYFSKVGIVPRVIQTIPSALYNFCRFELGEEIKQGEATIIVDVGAQHTDLIIVEPNSAWSRNIPLGGNNFTEALVKSFKLSFAKAENLKRAAATHKSARLIFQSMRPIFSDLVAEIQRSIGFYSSTHRDVALKYVLACGNAFHLPGLQKYLENNLTIPGGVRRLEKLNSLLTSATTNAPQFTDNILSFGPAYGLALQGLDLGPITASLLPPELARIQLWKRKRLYFAAAAACLALAAAFPWMRQTMDVQALAQNDSLGNQAREIINRAKQRQTEFNNASTDTTSQREKIDKLFELQKDRTVIPRILAMVHEALPEIPPAIAAAKTPDELKQVLKSDPGRYDRTQRRQMIIDLLEIKYSPDIDNMEPPQVQLTQTTALGPAAAGPGAMPGGRFAIPAGQSMQQTQTGMEGGGGDNPGFYVSIQGRLLYGKVPSEAIALITEDFYPRLQRLFNAPGLGFHVPEKDTKNLDANQRNLRIPQVTPSSGATQLMSYTLPGMAAPGGETAENLDPVTGEAMTYDWNFSLGFKIKLGEPPAVEGAKIE